MIKSGDIIKHEKSMDVCFDVIKVYEGSTSYHIKGRWMNQGFTESFYIFTNPCRIKLPKSEYKNLLYCKNPEFDICLRKAEWVYYEIKS